MRGDVLDLGVVKDGVDDPVLPLKPLELVLVDRDDLIATDDLQFGRVVDRGV